jgi:hypothetical protein
MPGEQIVQEVILQGEKDVVAALQRIGKVGDQAFGTLATSVRQVDTSKLQDNLEKVGKAGEGVAGRLRDAFKSIAFDGRDIADPLGEIQKAASQALTAVGNVGGMIGGFAKQAGVAGGVVAGLAAGMFTLAKSFSSAASAIAEGATSAGTSVASFQKMRFAAQQSGSSAEAMQKAYAQISSAAGEAIAKGERSAESSASILWMRRATRATARRCSSTWPTPWPQFPTLRSARRPRPTCSGADSGPVSPNC